MTESENAISFSPGGVSPSGTRNRRVPTRELPVQTAPMTLDCKNHCVRPEHEYRNTEVGFGGEKVAF